ncbi:MAG TPA: TfoX/Sxy family protein [Hyphomicrobiales bacterium]|nr:TfoX/Sxy family protein [Hyphomicrobiales bacterium]
MAYDQATAARVRAFLAGRGEECAEVPLMGGLSFMVHGHMCCGVRRDSLMVRVGPEAEAAALAEPFAEPMVFAGGRMRPKGYVVIAPEGYRGDAALAAWLDRGLAFVATLPPKKKPARKRRPGPSHPI